jgi:uncharacterized protein YkwD
MVESQESPSQLDKEIH